MAKQMQLPMAGSAGRSETTRRLKGRSIAAGLGMGSARIIGEGFEPAETVQSIQQHEIDRELERIRVAFEAARLDLEEASRRIETQFSPALAEVFHAHEMMLKSLQTSHNFEQEVQASLVNAEVAVRRVFQRWQQKFLALRGETFQQRSDDVADLGRKVLRHLAGDPAHPLQGVPEGSVLVYERLLPSDVVPLSRERVAALVVESLGHGSHAALLARGKGIPTVAGFPGLVEQLRPGEEVLVDGYCGDLVLAPDSSTRQHFQERLAQYHSTQVRCQGLCRQPARTLDGTGIAVEANVGIFEEVQMALENGADGVGLFRIEELYLTRELPPTEEELFYQLREITAPLRDKPLTIRLLDIGGDKAVPFLHLPPEANRLLGRRGVRLLFEYPELT
ncbi:MAG TPA: putative PEP-binding protein, partial [Bacillota bacterium]|nr:putative PEP-binding protein [Bacillota bacterium]